ncbi:hypothetical protein [Leptospira andrefontaineae]|uniref:Lipoprotein n=1 Tax=Leptospira andrefontaineae TaxID=2484976 RepID=A0A4V3JGE0_9LEPT|nr:hypothetical protein [Leptospira andrefontaineae]TGK42273.1 hypothetical protein EHO65_05795 [Leptospira andrefontaineae]
MKIKVLSIILIFLFLFSGCLSVHYRGRKIENHKNNFLKFEVKNFKERGNYEPHRFFYKVNQYRFILMWLDPDVYFPYPKGDTIPRSINPSEDYYINKRDGLTRTKIDQFFHGDRRDYFAYDCEYWMPLLSGKNEYDFYIIDENEGRKEGAWPEFDLPEDHSVRMKITPAMRTKGSDPANRRTGWYSTDPELTRKGFIIEFTIEKNRPGEQEPVCDLGIES